MTKREAKQHARQTLARVSESFTRRIALVEGIRNRVEDRLGRIEVLAALDVAEGALASVVLEKHAKASDYAVEVLGSAEGGRKSKSTAYRWLNAGMVGLVLRGPAVPVETTDETTGEPTTVLTYPEDILGSVPNAHIGSLAHLYRILSAAKAGDEESRSKQETLLRETWTDLLKSCEEDETEDEFGNVVEVLTAPDPDDVLAAAERVAPSNRSGGGGKSKSESEDDKSEDEDEGAESTRGDSTNLTTVEAAKVEAAAGPTDAILRGLTRTVEDGGLGVSEVQARGCMLAALRLAAEHGIGAVQAVLAGGVSAPSSEDEPTAEDETAAAAAAEGAKQ